MTQDTNTGKEQSIAFPDETILIVRPSLISICMGNKPSAKLLSVLIEHCNQGCSDSIHRTDAELIIDLCGEMSTKTLQDVAFPLLQALGYVSIEQKSCYKLHAEIISQALTEKKAKVVDQTLWESIRESIEEKIVRQNLHRAKKVLLPATLTVTQWRSTVEYFDNKCSYCKKRKYRVLEHFIPLSDKNSPGTVWSNCVPACYPCNTNNSKLHQVGLADVLAYLEKCKDGVQG